MDDHERSPEELLRELSELRARIAAWEQGGARDELAGQWLRDAEAIYRPHAEAIPNLLWRCDANGALTDCNEYWFEYSGLTLDETRDARWLNAVHPDDALRVLETGLNAGLRGEIYAAEYRLRARDGSYHWFRARSVPMKDAEGRILGWLGSAVDIDDERQVRTALHQSEQRFRSLVETTSDWVWAVDPNGCYTYASPKIRDLLGYEPQEVLGKQPFDLMAPEEAQRVRRLFQEIAQAQVPFSTLENTNLHRDGRRVVLDSSGVPIFDADGAFLGYQGIDRDITDRKRAEEALQKAHHELEQRVQERTAELTSTVRQLYDEVQERQRAEDALRVSEERLRMAIHATNDAIWDWNLIDGSVSCNETFTAAFGRLPAAESPWQWRLENVHPDDRPRIAESLQAAIEGHDRAWTAEYRFRRVDGQWAEICDRAYIARDASGTARRVVGAMLDITERKQAEAERRRLESQMLQSQKLESLGLLAGGIAHDFNNILAAIMGYADLALLRLPAAEAARADIQEIKNASQRAANLTRQMLAYSGKGYSHVEPLSLARLVDEMRGMLAISVSKKAALDYRLAADVPAVQGDAGQLNQVVMNLVINASEALGDQSGTISISVDSVPCDAQELASAAFGNDLPGGLYVCLEVADTGCGMSAQVLEHVFEPFFSTKFTGRGLGLSAVQGIVRRHQGAIRVCSAPLQGTTFRVFFPAAGPAPPRAPSKPVLAKPWRGSGTVLVVDDEELVRRTTQVMFELAGFTVLTAPDGEQGLCVYREHRQQIVCVILDLTMPKMDGMETLRELRRIDPAVRVILASGYGADGVAERFADQGVLGFIQKPEPLDGIIATLRQALESDADEGESRRACGSP